MVTVAHGPLSNMFRDPAFDAVSRRHDQGPVALPSIRQVRTLLLLSCLVLSSPKLTCCLLALQAIPELHLTKPSHRYSGSNLPSPTEQHHSGVSPEDDRERNGVPRLYRSPEHRHPSPSHRVPALPSLADLSASAGMAQQQQQQPQQRDTRYYEDSRREEPPRHHHHRGSYDYGYTHAPAGQHYDRPGSSYSHYQDSGRYSGGELGVMSMGGPDAKMRKRRGNLPKETTDKLRAWFVAHLQHPYPTEDEKQDLMRQTGLQMSALTPFALVFVNRVLT